LAVNVELLTNVVLSGLPFQSTTELATKPVPVTVRTNAPLPGAVPEWERGLKNGTGFGGAASSVIDPTEAAENKSGTSNENKSLVTLGASRITDHLIRKLDLG
jgi:hypothetical protein